MAYPASEAQVRFITDLAQRVYGPDNAPEHIAALGESGIFDDSRKASATIDALKVAARNAAHPIRPAVAELEDGMYRLPNGDILKVQHAVHGSGRQYAKRLVPPAEFGGKAEFEYAPGAMRVLAPEHRMSLEDAKAFGALYGTCCVCGRTLTDEKSIAAGIGPVCGKRV
jgi:hypothetical protein